MKAMRWNLHYTGREALRKVEAEAPVLALLDVMLPDMDGFAILQKIRESYTFSGNYADCKNRGHRTRSRA